MRILLAKIFRLLFKSEYLRSKYFGIHKNIFSPFNLFKGLILTVQVHDFKMILHIDDWIQENLYFLGQYEKAELSAIKYFLNEDSVFIDVGANIGLYSLYASTQIGDGGKVISFEPFGENFKALNDNIAINNFSNIQIEKLAVGEKNGVVNLHYDVKEKNRGMVSINYLEDGLTEEIKIVSLDSYLKNKSYSQIDLIKIDIEGHESAALLGMEHTLKTFHPTILIEILDVKNASGNSEKINTFLQNLGYRKYFIDDEGNLSKLNINHSRRNYIFTIEALADTK